MGHAKTERTGSDNYKLKIRESLSICNSLPYLWNKENGSQSSWPTSQNYHELQKNEERKFGENLVGFIFNKVCRKWKIKNQHLNVWNKTIYTKKQAEGGRTDTNRNLQWRVGFEWKLKGKYILNGQTDNDIFQTKVSSAGSFARQPCFHRVTKEQVHQKDAAEDKH